MPEQFHEDLLPLLITDRDRLNSTINEINAVAHYGDKFTASAKATAVASIKAAAGSIAKDYKGNARPVPVEPAVVE